MTSENISQNLKIVYLNIRSLRKKFTELEAIRMKYNCDIIILNEIWIKTSESKFFNLSNFEPVFNCRDDYEGGGCAIYVRSSLKFSRIELPNEFYSICLCVSMGNKNFKVATAYRPPDADVNSFIDYVDANLCKNNIVFFGDTNINILEK